MDRARKICDNDNIGYEAFKDVKKIVEIFWRDFNRYPAVEEVGEILGDVFMDEGGNKRYAEQEGIIEAKVLKYAIKRGMQYKFGSPGGIEPNIELPEVSKNIKIVSSAIDQKREDTIGPKDLAKEMLELKPFQSFNPADHGIMPFQDLVSRVFGMQHVAKVYEMEFIRVASDKDGNPMPQFFSEFDLKRVA